MLCLVNCAEYRLAAFVGLASVLELEVADCLDVASTHEAVLWCVLCISSGCIVVCTVSVLYSLVYCGVYCVVFCALVEL